MSIQKGVWQKELFREVVGGCVTAFAWEIGVNTSSILNYLHGRTPRADILFRIAQHTGRSMEEFLTPPEAQKVKLKRVG